MMNEAGILNPTRAYGAAYWVWLSSMAVCCLGGLATAELSERNKILNDIPAGPFRPLLPRTPTSYVSRCAPRNVIAVAMRPIG